MTGSSFNKAAAVTKHNTTNYPQVQGWGPAQALYVGTAGATGTVVLVTPQGASPITFTGVVAGSILYVPNIRVNSSTTDASNFVALWQV